MTTKTTTTRAARTKAKPVEDPTDKAIKETVRLLESAAKTARGVQAGRLPRTELERCAWRAVNAIAAVAIINENEYPELFPIGIGIFECVDGFIVRPLDWAIDM